MEIILVINADIDHGSPSLGIIKAFQKKDVKKAEAYFKKCAGEINSEISEEQLDEVLMDGNYETEQGSVALHWTKLEE